MGVIVLAAHGIVAGQTRPVTPSPGAASFLADSGYSSFADACAAANAASETVEIARTWNVAAGEYNCGKWFLKGGLLRVAASATVTISGDLTAPVTEQIFDVTTNKGAAIRFTEPSVPISVMWFGADASGARDNTAIYAAVMAALPENGGKVTVPSGTFEGSFVLPKYPKTVTVEGAGELATTLIPAAANTPLFTQGEVVSNFASPNHIVRGFSLKAHAAGSTGPAIDWNGLGRTTWEHLTFLSNGSGNFAIGILCDDQGSLKYCYENDARYITVMNQTGPSTVVKISHSGNANRFSNFYVVSPTGVTKIFDIENSATRNTIEYSNFEGNRSATVMNPGTGSLIIGNYFENNLLNVSPGEGGQNVFIANEFSGVSPKVNCRGAAWTFIGNIGNFDKLSCPNAIVQEGSILHNVAIGSMMGGLKSHQLSGPGFYAPYVRYKQLLGLPAGTYSYIITAVNAVGETTGSKPIEVTITKEQAPAAITLEMFSANGAISYNVYGRNCNTTCRLMGSVPGTFSSGAGLFVDDSSPTLSGGSPPATNDTGGIIADGPIGSTPAPFASLPACDPAHEGLTRGVTDSAANTWGAVVTGAGANHVNAYCDGSHWTVLAK